MINKKAIISIIIAAVVVVIISAANPFVIINAGERGVVLHWGAVQNKILDEGIHVIIPIVEHVEKLDVKTQKEEIDVRAASKDLQNVSSRIALNYHLDEENINLLWQKIGKNYKTRIIDPAIQEAIKAITAKYTAEELITKRDMVKEDAKRSLKERLAIEYVIVDELSIVDFNFSSEFNKAIEAKQTAVQDALKAENDLRRIKIEAEQRIAQAEAEAKAIEIQARAVTQQGGKDYVQLKAVEKWNGVLPAQMIPNATLPFINLGI